MRSPCCLCGPVNNPPPLYINFECWTNPYETWYVYHGTWAHLNGILQKSPPLVCVFVCVFLVPLLGKASVNCIPSSFNSRQRFGKHVPVATNTSSSRRSVVRVGLCISLSLLGNNSVKTFPRQWRIVGGVFFYAIHVISKETRRLLLPRTSCLRYGR
jgi:hypothetical protein